MGVFSDYLEAKILNHVFNNIAYTPPTRVYVALMTGGPSDAGGGTEVTGGSYARAYPASGWTVTSGDGIAKNASAITWPTATADWGNVTHIAMYDALTGGNLLAWSPLVQAKPIYSGDIIRFLTNQLQIALG